MLAILNISVPRFGIYNRVICCYLTPEELCKMLLSFHFKLIETREEHGSPSLLFNVVCCKNS